MNLIARAGDRELSLEALLDHPLLPAKIRRSLDGRVESLPAFLEHYRQLELHRDRLRDSGSATTVKSPRDRRRQTGRPLELEDRKCLVDQALLLFQKTYAHLPFKRSFYGVDPVQRLRLLRLRLDFQGEEVADESVDEGVTDTVTREMSDLEFHREMIDIFTSVRDLHTLYMLPAPFSRCVAFLPFTVEEYFNADDRQGHNPRYMVADVMKGVEEVLPKVLKTGFKPGVEILYWNGVPMRRAVEVIAEKHSGGSNAAARRVRALDRCTFRPLVLAMPPDEQWVEIRYRSVNSRKERCIVFYWQAYRPSAGDQRREILLKGLEAAATRALRERPPKLRTTLRLDVESRRAIIDKLIDARPETVSPRRELPLKQEARNRLIATPPAQTAVSGGRFKLNANAKAALIQRLARAAGDGPPSTDPMDTAGPGDGFDLEIELRRELRSILFEPPRTAEHLIERRIPTYAPEIFEAFSIKASDVDRPLGLIRIYTFAVGKSDRDVNRFVTEFAELLDHPDLPQDGLIIDVRGNGGGRIPAGERLLQLLTPRTIDPENFEFVNTPLNLEFLRRHSRLAETEGREKKLEDWMSSIKSSIATGAIYSRGFPITPEELCNNIGQRYYGPVLLLVDAKCYSTTDIFIAGFKDHEIGEILAVHENTGAGGASVVSHQTLLEIFDKTQESERRSPFVPLPSQAEMQVALRRSIRVGTAAGRPLENLGVRPDDISRLIRRDVLRGAGGHIYERAARTLAAKPTKALRFEIGELNRGFGNGEETLKVSGKGVGFFSVSMSGIQMQPVGGWAFGEPYGEMPEDEEPSSEATYDCQMHFEIPEDLHQYAGNELAINGWFTPEEWGQLKGRSPNPAGATPQLGRRPVATRRIQVDDVLRLLDQARRERS